MLYIYIFFHDDLYNIKFLMKKNFFYNTFYYKKYYIYIRIFFKRKYIYI